jgi:S-DNA-T family DNA segregation ATPase FtsK/SpoIIIE
MTVHGADVEIDDPAGATLAAARELLEPLTGPWPAGWEEFWRVGGEPVAGTVLGRPPLLAGAVVPEPAGDTAADRSAGGELPVRVVAGPDAGRLLTLGAGTHRVGRSDEVGNVVGLDDPSVSRVHAELTVHDDGTVTVRDTGSLNGTTLLRPDDPRPVDPATEVQFPARVGLGDSVLELGPPPTRAASLRPDGDGRLLLNRPPRLVPPAESQVLRWPGEQPDGDAPEFPVLALLVPLAVAGVLALVWTPLSLLLGLASPLLVGGQWWTQRRRHAASTRRRRAGLETARAQVRRSHHEALVAEHVRAHALAPDAAVLFAEVLARGERVFGRSAEHPDHLHCRLGLGERPATSVTLHRERTDAAGALDPDASGPDPVLRDVPVSVSLTEGPLGLAGGRPALLRTARFVLAQLAGWHSPATLRLAVAGPSPDWAWTRWLPHLIVPDRAGDTVLASATRELAHRRASARGVPERWAGADHVVVLLDEVQRWRSDPRLADLLETGTRYGVHVVCLARDVTELPAECRSVVALDAAPARLDTGAGSVAFRRDGVGARWAERLARGLAPLRDAGASTAAATPLDVRLLDLLGAASAEDLVRAWDVADGGLRVPLGVGGQGFCSVDLAVDGPHTLVAGTTGSGKSVLLRTLVAGLCAGYPPESVQLVLVDYKGGAAFGDCVRLPHVAGVVTDLDDQLAARVLRSLRAEVRRREEVLSAAGAADVRDLARGKVPRLVVVVDEFRVLAQELPEFVDGLVRLAAVGRSLGIHLVLATQRPAGVVSPEIRANTNLRIALRVQDRADAEDVVGDPAPAGFSDRTPGRAVLRRGSDALQTFQAARLSGPVRRNGLRVGAPGDVAGADEVDDLPGLVAAVRTAASDRQVPPSPWLAPLAAELASGTVPAAGGTALTWGLLDLPDAQRQEVAGWDLAAGGHLLVVGGVRSGRTTLLRRLVTAVGRGPSASPVEVHVLDAGGGLADLAGRGGTGSVVAASEVWRAGRLLRRLQEEVERRRAHGSRGEHLVLLVVDGWEAWASALSTADPTVGPEALLRLLREASGVGVRVVVAADRAALTGPVAAACAQVVLLRLPDRADAALLGVRSADVPRQAPPGRGLLVADGRGHEVQVALPFPPDASPGWSRLGVAPLPASVSIAEIGTGDGELLPLGRGGDEAGAVVLDTRGAVLVCGPPGSGRTTVLRTLADTEAAAGRTPCWAREADPDTLAAALTAGALVLLDDVARPLPPGPEDVLLSAVNRGGPLRLVVSGDGSELAGAFRGLAAAVRTTARTTVLLGRNGIVPAEVLSRRPVTSPGEGPGAGFVVRDGVWTSVRVAGPGACPRAVAGQGPTSPSPWPTVVG